MAHPVRIVRASSREQTDLLAPRLADLTELGFTPRYEDLPPDPAWAYTAATPAARADALMTALAERDTLAVWCARGGYGASDLLPLLDWDALATLPPKLVVGFSDVSALHSAFYARLGWPGLHGPMPATVLWGKDGERRDIDAVAAAVRALGAGAAAQHEIAVRAILTADASSDDTRIPASGPLFGGCFSVLTSLIGTPYFPRSLQGHIVFFEDVDEHPGRLVRALNQWLQAGALRGVRAVVVGHLRRLGDSIPDDAPFVLQMFAERVGVPVYHTPLVGHTSPNFPVLVGGEATITNGLLRWQGRLARRVVT